MIVYFIWRNICKELHMQGRNCKEDFAAEQLLVEKWVRGGGGGVTLLRLQGGPVSYKWKV